MATDDPGAIWLVTGAQASGKSTTADLLARSFDKGVHVSGSQFYRWGVSGWKHYDDPDRAVEAGAVEALAPMDPEGMPRCSAVKDPSGNWIWLYQG